MKIASLLGLNFLVFGSIGLAQQPTQAISHLGLDFVKVETGASTDRTVKGGGASIGEARSVAPRFKATVINFGSIPEDATVEWFVFARDLSSREKNPDSPVLWRDSKGQLERPPLPFLHDSGFQQMNVPPKKTIEAMFASKPVESTNNVSNKLTNPNGVQQIGNTKFITRGFDSYISTTKHIDGQKFLGWMARLRVGGQVVRVKASDRSFENMGRLAVKVPSRGEDLQQVMKEDYLKTEKPRITADGGPNGVSIRMPGGGSLPGGRDGLELHVDRGQGWQSLGTNTHGSFFDNKVPYPATPTKWRYRAINRVNGIQAGLWSDVVTVPVGGKMGRD